MIAVNPAYTSRTCSACGERTPQEHYRVYACPACDSLLGRDVNAARNVMARAFGATQAPLNSNGAGDSPRSARAHRAALVIVG